MAKLGKDYELSTKPWSSFVSVIINLKQDCSTSVYAPLCEDHNPIAFEAYLGNIGSYNILHWHRFAVGAADFIGMVEYSSNIVKVKYGSDARQATICDHMWSVTYRQVAYYSITNS